MIFLPMPLYGVRRMSSEGAAFLCGFMLALLILLCAFFISQSVDSSLDYQWESEKLCPVDHQVFFWHDLSEDLFFKCPEHGVELKDVTARKVHVSGHLFWKRYRVECLNETCKTNLSGKPPAEERRNNE